MITNFRHKLCFADSLALERNGFSEHHYKQLMPEPLQSHPSVFSFYKIYADFHLFKFRQEETNGNQDVGILSLSNFFL